MTSDDNKRKLIIIVLAVGLMGGLIASAQTIYESITCTNCILDNPVFVNFSVPTNWGDGSKVNKTGDLFDGKFYQHDSSTSNHFFWNFNKTGTTFNQHNQFGDFPLMSVNQSTMDIFMNIQMNTGSISDLANPISNQDAATKLYVDTANNLKVNKSGDTINGFLNFLVGKGISIGNIVPNFSNTYPLVIYQNDAGLFLSRTNGEAFIILTTRADNLGIEGGQIRSFNHLAGLKFVSSNGTGNFSGVWLSIKPDNVSIPYISGSGNAAVCVDSSGKIFRSTNATSNYLTC